jgi:hypothetical protein
MTSQAKGEALRLGWSTNRPSTSRFLSLTIGWACLGNHARIDMSRSDFGNHGMSALLLVDELRQLRRDYEGRW